MPAITQLTSKANFILSCSCALLLLHGCSNEKIMQGQPGMNGLTPHQAYAASLEEADLDKTALGQAWFEAGHAAISKAVSIEAPFKEVGYLDPKEVTARGYQINLLHGQRLSVQVSLPASDSLRLFIDLYEVPVSPEEPLRHVATADSTNAIFVEPKKSMSYLIRVQPELLRGGKYTIEIEASASLEFPVAAHTTRHIFSFWGAPRDGGRRLHKGVDVFAPVGTPVVAISSGYVVRVEETKVGGKVIWVRDAIRNQAYYYAHLHEFFVEEGERVETGDTLGSVGNTGNAINTPSHLHFGIYTAARRPKDPLPFIHNIKPRTPHIAADTSQLGSWVRITAKKAALRKSPYQKSELQDYLPHHTALKVAGGISDWFYVLLPDGKQGFIQARYTEEADAPIRSLQLAAGQPIKYKPSYSAVAIDSIAPNSQVAVFGEFQDFVGVTSPNGKTGWIVATD